MDDGGISLLSLGGASLSLLVGGAASLEGTSSIAVSTIEEVSFFSSLGGAGLDEGFLSWAEEGVESLARRGLFRAEGSL